jgi:hypothetical protein
MSERMPTNRFFSMNSSNLPRNNMKAPSKQDTFYCLARGGCETRKPTTTTVYKVRSAEEEEESRPVRFDKSRNETYFIPTIDELSDHEFFATYYDALDFKVFKGCCLDAVKSMRHGIPEDDRNCYRGLESIGCSRRKLNRRNGAFQVLDEQGRQFEEGILCSPEEIAARYSLISNPCRHEAFRRGLLDAKAAMSLDGS